MAKDVKHFQDELRNCIYQLSMEHLIEVLTSAPADAEALRYALKRMAENENREDEAKDLEEISPY
jgi:hypothetical protein